MTDILKQWQYNEKHNLASKSYLPNPKDTRKTVTVKPRLKLRGTIYYWIGHVNGVRRSVVLGTDEDAAMKQYEEIEANR